MSAKAACLAGIVSRVVEGNLIDEVIDEAQSLVDLGSCKRPDKNAYVSSDDKGAFEELAAKVQKANSGNPGIDAMIELM